MNWTLKDQVVVITGASRGLGQALVSAFLEHDARVAGLIRSPTEQTNPAGPPSTSSPWFIQADVAVYAEVERAVATVQAHWGGIDILINNAAVYPRTSFLQETAGEWHQAIATNINGVANGCKAVLPGMIERNHGIILNVGSFADIAPIANSAAYSASKGAVRALTKAIAKDLPEGSGVLIHEWIPGHLRTRMSEFTGIDPMTAARWAIEVMQNPAINQAGQIFERNAVWQKPLSRKQKALGILKKLFGRDREQ